MGSSSTCGSRWKIWPQFRFQEQGNRDISNVLYSSARQSVIRGIAKAEAERYRLIKVKSIWVVSLYTNQICVITIVTWRVLWCLHIFFSSFLLTVFLKTIAFHSFPSLLWRANYRTLSHWRIWDTRAVTITLFMASELGAFISGSGSSGVSGY